MAYQLRELKVGGILDQAVSVMKDRFGLLVGITASLYLPLLLLTSFVSLAMTPQLPPNPTLEDVRAVQGAALQNLVFTLPLVVLLQLIVLPITWGAIIHAVSKVYLNEPTSVGESLKGGAGRAVALIGSWILVVLCIFGGLILLIIPGILCAFWFALVPQVVVIERLAGPSALGRSRALTKGSIGTIFVLGVLLSLIQFAVGFAAGRIPEQYIRAIVVAVIQAVFFAFSTAASVILYFSCRCHHENFDLVRLAQSVSGPEGEFTPAIANE